MDNRYIIIISILVIYLIYINNKIKGSFIKNLKWRRAEKHFLPGPVDINLIKKAIINAPSSYGIQPFHVIQITNQHTKLRLKPVCMNQAQITESYCLFIFCALNNIEERIDQYVKNTEFEFKKKFMLAYIDKLPLKIEWAKRQAYIALGFGLAAAMELNIASCPMEGFDPEGISRVLKLDKNLVPCVLLTVGIKDDNYKLEKRFRFDNDDMFTII